MAQNVSTVSIPNGKIPVMVGHAHEVTRDRVGDADCAPAGTLGDIAKVMLDCVREGGVVRASERARLAESAAGAELQGEAGVGPAHVAQQVRKVLRVRRRHDEVIATRRTNHVRLPRIARLGKRSYDFDCRATKNFRKFARRGDAIQRQVRAPRPRAG